MLESSRKAQRPLQKEETDRALQACLTPTQAVPETRVGAPSSPTAFQLGKRGKERRGRQLLPASCILRETGLEFSNFNDDLTSSKAAGSSEGTSPNRVPGACVCICFYASDWQRIGDFFFNDTFPEGKKWGESPHHLTPPRSTDQHNIFMFRINLIVKRNVTGVVALLVFNL